MPPRPVSEGHTSWCDTQLHSDRCQRRYASVGGCFVWLEQAGEQEPPVVVIGAGVGGSPLTLDEVKALRTALDDLLTTVGDTA